LNNNDLQQLKILPLSERLHGLGISIIKEPKPCNNRDVVKKFIKVSESVISATKKKSSVIIMVGGHVIRSGVQKYLIDLMKRGYVSCIAMNGAGVIHDFELALIGATTESVAKYISNGQFGLWKEVGYINDIINDAYRSNSKKGMGYAVGEAINNGKFPHKDISLLSAGYRLRIPVTIHVGIGYDINHEHPNCDGAATGATSYNDFLTFAGIVQNLEGGVIMNFGSAVMAPEVFLKALSMARNIAHQEGQAIKHFTTLVCDIHDVPDDFKETPSNRKPAYYFRPWKTMLVRTVKDGGESYFIKGRHSDTIPALWSAINEVENPQIAQVNEDNKTKNGSVQSEKSEDNNK